MAKYLIIVESPSKAKTLGSFLGKEYVVRASMGHVRDLPKRKLGIDIENGFRPEYQIIKGKEKTIKDLKELVKQAEVIYLASDPDREGEAIAWHLAQVLHIKDPKRIEFHEITKKAVSDSLNNVKNIDLSLVEAQETRRTLDRLVGYTLSPVLWTKIKKGLSAGRVQSVAVHLVTLREKEIENFVPQEYWNMNAQLETVQEEKFTASIYAFIPNGIDDIINQKKWQRIVPPGKEDDSKKEVQTEEEELSEKKIVLKNYEMVEKILNSLNIDKEGKPSLNTPKFIVIKTETKENIRNAPFPYITSTLQQDSSSILKFSPDKTMKIAQELYEGIALGKKEQKGLITYMRTDSTRVSDEAVSMAHKYIDEVFGKKYIKREINKVKNKAHAQDAHEAIRPTDVYLMPEQIREYLSLEQYNLYSLIWHRFLASQMASAIYVNTIAYLKANQFVFKALGTVQKFDGYTQVWNYYRNQKEEEQLLPDLSCDQETNLILMQYAQHSTKAPARYTEASLIKDLEAKGVGRPSTYATIIKTIKTRNYVEEESRNLYPTQLGRIVDDYLEKHFYSIVDYKFTASMEDYLDEISEGKKRYFNVLNEWYTPFYAMITEVNNNGEKIMYEAEKTGQKCPECGHDLVFLKGKYGKFIGCSNYPECKYRPPKEGVDSKIEEKFADKKCSECGRPMKVRKGKQGVFLGCSGFPECKHTEQIEDESKPKENLGHCPECGSDLVRKKGKFGPFVGCSDYPNCRYIQKEDKK